jgi:hypothetical protein
MQLGLTPKDKFIIKHSITFEHDALITKVEHPDGHESLDIIGRAVVLAFRLSGVKSVYPHIITQGSLVPKSRGNQIKVFDFKPVTFKQIDYLRYFKGEKWGTDSIYAVSKSRWTKKSIAGAKDLHSILSAPQNMRPHMLSDFGITPGLIATFDNVVNYMRSGPDWSKGLLTGFIGYFYQEMLPRVPLNNFDDTKEGRKEFVSEFRRLSKEMRKKLGI